MPPRAIWVIVIVLLLITLPYLYAARAAGPEYVFGGFLFNPQDGNTYLAKMYEGWRGDWRFTLPFTAQRGQGTFIYPFYIFLGHLARWLDLSLPLTYHLARLLAAVIMLLALWRFLRATVSVNSSGAVGRRVTWAYALAALGLGMGWLVFPFGLIMADFWVAETYPFLSAYTNPHFALSLAALLWLLTFASSEGQATPRMRLWNGLAAALISFLLATMSPFGVVLALALPVGLLAWELASRLWGAGANPLHDDSMRGKISELLAYAPGSIAPRAILERIVWILVGCVLPLFYEFWVIRADPLLAAWNAQNQTLTPAAWDIGLALSPALLLAIPGAWWIIRSRQVNSRLLLIWAVFGLVCIYLPFSLQRRFMMGLFIPMTALAGYGIEWLAERLPLRPGLVASVTFACSIPTMLLILLVGLFGVQTHDPLIYLTRGEVQAFAWIEQNTQPDALILAAPETGLLIPAYTGRRVIYGHPYETINAEAEKGAVTSFFNGSLDVPAVFLDQRKVDYIFYGPRERALGDLPAAVSANIVFNVDGVIIYQAPGAQ